jgi:hypothetical protein
MVGLWYPISRAPAAIYNFTRPLLNYTVTFLGVKSFIKTCIGEEWLLSYEILCCWPFCFMISLLFGRKNFFRF